jgi:hypothetical protein
MSICKLKECGYSDPWKGKRRSPVQANRNDEQKNSPFQDHNIVFLHKHQHLPIRSHGAITQMTTILIITSVKTSEPTILKDNKGSNCDLF